MTKVTFTQFCKELARVHGTHQHSKPSSKVVSVSTVESNLGDEAALSKAKQKCKAKISVQSSQIWDLHSKLDAAIAENSQISEFLKPETLHTVVMNAFQTAQSGGMIDPTSVGQVNHFKASIKNHSSLQAKMVLSTWKRCVGTVKIPDMIWITVSTYSTRRI